ncbi:MAG: hypothetical protein SOU51_01160 [Collinsella sp.]|nr:hypothetical protein [Collinsella sp.]
MSEAINSSHPLKSLDDVGSPAELACWLDEAMRKLRGAARDWPACWGWQYRIGDGGYVSEAAWNAIIPSDSASSLFIASFGDEPLESLFLHRLDDSWLDAAARDYIDSSGCEVFGTEIWPDEDFSDQELRELSFERPDLFTPSNLASLPSLSAAIEGRGPTRKHGMKV